jgi:hypothetical protein
MRMYDNGIYRDMTKEEEDAVMAVTEKEGTANKDGLTSLAEGLSTATSLAQVRSAAKSVLANESEGANE